MRRTMLSFLAQVVAVWGQERFGRIAHATKLANSWPNLCKFRTLSPPRVKGMESKCTYAHQIDSTVKRYWCVPGKNSRKMALSTGRLPPTPTLQMAARTHRAVKVGEPAAAVAKMPTIKRVVLNDTLVKNQAPLRNLFLSSK